LIECAAILAGGLGTRLRPAVNDRQKVMASVEGRPFLAFLLDRLAAFGVRRTVLCTGYRADEVRVELGDSFGTMELAYSVEPAPLGTGGALRLAAPLLTGESFLVLNGDSFCQCDLADFHQCWRASGAEAGMALAHVDDISRFGAVETDPESRVTTFAEKGNRAGSGWINAGIYLFRKNIFDDIPADRPTSLEYGLFPRLISRGIHGYRCRGPFIDIGIPEEYQRAQTYFSQQ
jgi:D-glycero-alpha-D-manno-heptose 1-phosphate guanylyltransferase